MSQFRSHYVRVFTAVLLACGSVALACVDAAVRSGPPVVTLTANPTSIASGASSTLTWNATGATACTASGGWTGAKTTSGNQSTGALVATTTFTLACSGGGGSDSESANVTVIPVPTVTLSANPTSVASGGSSMLTWSSTNATGCTASGGWTGAKATSGTQSTGALTSTTTYTLTCAGPGGSGNQSATVTVNPAPTVTLTANPTGVISGGSSQLTWSSTNATACTASNGWSGAKATSGTQSTGALTTTTSYTLTCTGLGGSANQTATVTVSPNPAPTVTLTANPTSVASGGSATLTWSTTDATACTASVGWTGAKATSGSQSTGAVTVTTTYTLTCTGPGGSGNQSATVTVIPAPTVTLTANPTSVASGGSSTLTWNTTNATACTASVGWTGAKATSGSQSTGAIAATTTYTLTCTGTGGSGNQSATVTVVPAPTVTLSANPTSVASGGSSTLTWSSTNATACTASGGWTGAKATSGSQSTGAIAATTTYTLTCTGTGGSGNQSATVTVTPAPTVTLSANPTSVANGGSSTLTWSSTNATGCTASNGWSGAKATSGSQSTGTLTSNTTFSMACSGPGGTSNLASATVTIQASGGIFPLHMEAGKRYLVDAQGNPFLIHGDAPWSLMVQLNNADVDQYLEDRRSKGFNTVLVNLIEHEFSLNPPRNILGDLPFLTLPLFVLPNEVYFAHADYVISKAAEKGILVLLTPSYMGAGGGSQGWYSEMGVNGTVNLQLYGAYLANRFRAYDNIVWVHGGDYDPPEKNLMRAIVNGIQSVDTKWPHTFHGARGTNAMEFLGTGEAWLTVNNIYTDNTTVVTSAFQEFNRSSIPFFMIEGIYENEGIGAAGVRQQAYQAVLSGASGQIMGNNPIWDLSTGWQTALNSGGARSLRHLRTLLEARTWWTMVPDQTGAVLTAGAQTGSSRAVASRAADGSFVLLYMPDRRTVTIDMTKLSGPNVTARWYDPNNGTFTTVAGSPFANTGTRSFSQASSNSGGDDDWVLVLESSP